MSTSAVNISSMFTSFLALQNIKCPSEFYKLFSAVVFPPKLREQCTNIFTVYRVITYSLSVQTKKRTRLSQHVSDNYSPRFFSSLFLCQTRCKTGSFVFTQCPSCQCVLLIYISNVHVCFSHQFSLLCCRWNYMQTYCWLMTFCFLMEVIFLSVSC